nr:MAG TPA: Sigma factor-binding transcriptional regulator Crl [Caudoviricetes sp.]
MGARMVGGLGRGRRAMWGWWMIGSRLLRGWV